MARPSNTAERRAQIARALLQVMAKKGYERATVTDVAEVAGIAPGLVHYHFQNKLDILLCAIGQLADSYQQRLDRHLLPCRSPEQELQAFVDAHLHVGRQADPQALACWIDISGEALREPRVKKAFAAVIGSSVRRLTEILKRGSARGAFSAPDPDMAAAAIVSTIQGYFVIAATARDLIPRGSAARATMAMCQGLLAPASAPRGKRERP